MTEDKLPLTSQDVLTDKIAALRELFPEAFAEDKVDFERLRQALGKSVDEGRERYGLSWAGKSEAVRNLQVQSVGTLNPVPEESVNFETTENIFIEGDNLEVLKLLQKSYHNQIKMIYIDPPYNTGKEFIYPDNFREGLEDYLRYSGQKNGEGIKLTTHAETDGRFHSKWLNMMYPRLFLARSLLSEDGIIFISIDDHEVATLKMVCNEIFGEENFIGQFIIQSNPRGSQSNKFSALVHEYLLIFSRNSTVINSLGQELSDEMREEYSFQENDRKYRLLGLRQRGGAWRRHDRPLLYYPLYIDPESGRVSLSKDETHTIKVFPIKPTTLDDGTWRWNKSKVSKNTSDLVGRKVNRDNDEVWDIYQKDFLENDSGEERLTKPKTIWNEKEMNYQNGTTEVKALFDGKDCFDFPKPTSLVKKIIKIGCAEDSTILDFFGGSGTTAHAVLDLNSEDGGNRKFIIVQLPELTENPEFKTIADIGKERVRRAIKKISEEENGKLDLNGSAQQDRGFKVFKLTESNFKIWDGTAPQTVEQLEVLLEEFAGNVRPGTSKLGMLYEILLKAGFPLTAKIEKLDIAGQEIYAIEDQELFICMEYEILEDAVRQILTHQPKPSQFISLDSSFRGNDQLKTNTQLQMRDHDIKFRTV